jgi:mannose-6-phosphate isomerase
MDEKKAKVFKLQGRLVSYDWGGKSFLPDLLRIPNPQNRPFAEFWIGANDGASSEILDPPAHPVPLNEYIRFFPMETLGKKIATRFGHLPYLLKILDVERMLSIQVHPSKQDAEMGFFEEEKKGISRTAPHRNYKDANHKPELMVALSEFWLLHGFKKASSLRAKLESVPELNFLVETFHKRGYQGLYGLVMEMEQTEVNQRLGPLLDRVIPAYHRNQLTRDQEEFWAARAAGQFTLPNPIDRGIFSIFFFNLLHLHPGEAIFQDAGLPHAYLEGQNIEIMANSDNVLRGGLSSKHIDVPELMKHVLFRETLPKLIRGEGEDEEIKVFPTPAPDFELSRIKLGQGRSKSFYCLSTVIYLILRGQVRVLDQENEFTLQTGDAFIGFDRAFFELKALEDSEIYKAAVPAEIAE